MRTVLFTALAALTFAFAASAQTGSLTTRTLVADLTPSAENPPVVDTDASGSASIAIHIVRDDAGAATAAIVDFRIMWTFGQEEMVVGLHIHEAPAGSNGGVVVNSGLMGPIPAGPGSGTFLQSTGVIEDADRIAKLMEIMDNPAGFYANLHTLSNRPGIIRGQLGNSVRHMVMTANGKLDAVSADLAETDAEVERIGTTIDAIARRLGIVPAN